jgi:hypothetical protein
MDHIKVGGIVLVKGRVQQNPGSTKAQPSNGSSSSSRRVLDVVAHEVLLLHKHRDMLAKAVRAAQRQGVTGVTTAAELLQLQEQQEQQLQQGASAVESVLEQSGATQQLGIQNAGNATHGTGSTTSSRSAASYQTSRKAGSSSSNGQPSRSESAPAQQAEPATSSPSAAAGAESAEDGGKFWQLPSHIASSIHWVSDEQGIASMQQLVLPQACENSSSSSSSSGVPAADIVVGLDCEWRPYDKNSPATPVALLQLATRQHVFLVDLLAICQQQQHSHPCSENSNSSKSEQVHSSSSSSRRGVTPAEGALSRFLLSLLCDPRLVKVGFQLGSDLARLQVTPQCAVVITALLAVVSAD